MAAIRRVLIANRGEIALRIMRSCRKLGIETVLTVSEADRDSLPARHADRVVCIGPAPSSQSYLRPDTIMQAALSTDSQAIHPGYGFLSERTQLAMLCEENDVAFIGPTAAQIAAVGDKLRARAHAVAAQVPVVPGGPVSTQDDAEALFEHLGAPVLIKAVGGGGGRGMKLVPTADDLPGAVQMAAAEAGAAFGDGRIYMERYVARGRHVEVQVLGDGGGRVLHLGERDCSVQRRYQKLVEETPAPGISPELRARICNAAVRFAAALNYRGAGTVEFLLDAQREAFYFLEMNARIQVEHPVTEMVSGVDLIAEQIAIAAGQGLKLTQEQIALQGAAVECRINAEDPRADFMPSPGRVTTAQWPKMEGVRVDTWIETGSMVPPYYDSLLGKIIVHASTREAAIVRMREALAATRIEGVRTNLEFQSAVLGSDDFAAGGVDTNWLGQFIQREDWEAPRG
ncbi:MAG TPA: acetyl-CoA carboxylase biotin carboxylase subunit [Steroidobacteraceae bacterium]|nr:acetyl-CoA carboxylase biotin carboxylase subunit [Steroidobacteraceae bacterium]